MSGPIRHHILARIFWENKIECIYSDISTLVVGIWGVEYVWGGVSNIENSGAGIWGEAQPLIWHKVNTKCGALGIHLWWKWKAGTEDDLWDEVYIKYLKVEGRDRAIKPRWGFQPQNRK